MKKLLFVACAVAAACGGSDGSLTSAPKPVDLFIGAPWSGTLSSNATCPGQPPSNSTENIQIVLSKASDADLQYTSQDGCVFKFSLAGPSAQLANAPVNCPVAGPPPLTLTIQKYALSTTDGHNMMLTGSGTAVVSGTTCTIAVQAALTR